MTKRTAIAGLSLMSLLGFGLVALGVTVPQFLEQAQVSAQTALSEVQAWTGTIVGPRPSTPLEVRIPAINVTAKVEQVGQDASGAMADPSSWWTVGWYKHGTRPGARGSAVMAGHLDSDTGTAVFWKLDRLKPGDTVEVTDDKGVTRTFVVEKTEVYDDSKAPMQEIFASDDGSRLNLITCDGTWDERTGEYGKRLVVYTKLRE